MNHHVDKESNVGFHFIASRSLEFLLSLFALAGFLIVAGLFEYQGFKSILTNMMNSIQADTENQRAKLAKGGSVTSTRGLALQNSTSTPSLPPQSEKIAHISPAGNNPVRCDTARYLYKNEQTESNRLEMQKACGVSE